MPKVDSLPPASATARCASGHMLETPSIPRYSSAADVADSENAPGADNQQERPAHERESSETIRQTSERSDDEMVPSAWRHAGMASKECHPLARVGSGHVQVRR